MADIPCKKVKILILGESGYFFLSITRNSINWPAWSSAKMRTEK